MNLDSLDVTELLDFVTTHTYPWTQDYATEAQNSGAVASQSHTLAIQVAYCEQAIKARSARLTGKIETALAHEARADRLYGLLPDGKRW